MNVSLPEDMKRWVEQQANSGRYGNSSDYVRDLIRRDQARQMKIKHLQALVSQGIESGPTNATMEDIRQAALGKLQN